MGRVEWRRYPCRHGGAVTLSSIADNPRRDFTTAPESTVPPSASRGGRNARRYQDSVIVCSASAAGSAPSVEDPSCLGVAPMRPDTSAEMKGPLALLLRLLSIVAAGSAVAVPVFSDQYTTKGMLYIPSDTKVAEPFEAWIDRVNNRSRIDYHNGKISVLFLKAW